jgi:hypothetical protein
MGRYLPSRESAARCRDFAMAVPVTYGAPSPQKLS